MKLGTVIRLRRRALSITQAEMANQIGVCQSFVAMVERGKRGLLLENFLQVCRLFETDPTTLLREGGIWK